MVQKERWKIQKKMEYFFSSWRYSMQEKEVAIFDLEADGLLDSLTQVHSLVVHFRSRLHSFHGPAIADGIEMVRSSQVLVGHNILCFDLPALKKVYGFEYAGEVFDTLTVSRLLYPGEGATKDGISPLLRIDMKKKFVGMPKKLYGSHSLEAWGYRLGEYKGDYTGGWENWSEEMQRYCEQDVVVTKKLYEKFSSKNYSQTAIDIEHDFQSIIFQQEKNGVLFDVAKAREYAERIGKDLASKKEEISRRLPPKRTPFTPKRDNRTLGYRKGETIYKEEPFNPGSRDQIINFFKEKYSWKPTLFTDKGNPKVDDDVLNDLPFEEAKDFAQYFERQKILGYLSKGKGSWLNYVRNGRIHGGVITNGTITGRCTHCIEENQLVTLVGGIYKKIKDVSEGDLVYCYDKEGNLKIRPVLNVIYKGENPCYRVDYVTNTKSSGGHLLCTSNHKILTYKGWKRLKDIKIGTKLAHLTILVNDGRKTLCMINRKSRRQCTFIKEEYFYKYGREWHIHHKDENKLNDNIENLEVLSASEHMKLHSPKYMLGYTKVDILKMLVKSKGRPSKIPMDFNSYKRYCDKYGIDLHKMCLRYSKKNKKYIHKNEILRIIDKSPYYIGKVLGIDGRKSRIDKLLDAHGLVINHWVKNIQYVGVKKTYDLEIKEHHNFICQELCVSNSSPNLSQVPSVRKYMGKECRELFHSGMGYMVGIDLSGLELRMLGHYLARYDGGRYAKEIITGDIHTANQMAAGLPDRDTAKTFIYAYLYGAGNAKLGSIITNGVDEVENSSIGKDIRKRFLSKTLGLEYLTRDVRAKAQHNGYVKSLDGRILTVRKDYRALNTLLQGGGAVCCKKANINFWEMNTVDCQQVLSVHDETQFVAQSEHEAEIVGEYYLRAIYKVMNDFNLRIPLDGEYKIGKNWGDTH